MSIFRVGFRYIHPAYFASAIILPQLVNLTTLSVYAFAMEANSKGVFLRGVVLNLLVVAPMIMLGTALLQRASLELNRYLATIIVSVIVVASFAYTGNGKQPTFPSASFGFAALIYLGLSFVTFLLIFIIGRAKRHPSQKDVILTQQGYPIGSRASKIWFLALEVSCLLVFILSVNFASMRSSDLMKEFDRSVRSGDDYRAALIMKELCTREPENSSQHGMQTINCHVVVNAYPHSIEFSRDQSKSGPVDWTGVAHRKPTEP